MIYFSHFPNYICYPVVKTTRQLIDVAELYAGEFIFRS